METLKPHPLTIAVAAALIASCGGGNSGSSTPASTALSTVDQKLACASLGGLVIPQESIGLPTTGAVVTAASDVTDTDASGASRNYCKVTGAIYPVDQTAMPINFQVNLPKTWNQRALQIGGGGLDGSVVTGTGSATNVPPTIPTPIARGYVTLGSDSGHNGASNANAAFASNQEQLMNFAQYSIKKTVDVAKYIVQQMYGQKPTYTYFIGGSQGGHEAVQAAQRYPDDYEGIIGQYPVFNVIHMWNGQNAAGKAIHTAGLTGASPSWINPNKAALLFTSVMNACDGLDGVVDGIVSNVPACNAAYNITNIRATLRCANGADTGDTCFSDPQLDMIQAVSSPVTFNYPFAGNWITFPKWQILDGASVLGFGATWFGSSGTVTMDPTTFAYTGASAAFGPSSGALRGIVVQSASFDVYTYSPDTYKARVQQTSSWLDDVSLDYSRFAARGGKMLTLHGSVDQSITGTTNLENWKRLVAANGQAFMDSFARFYYVPGMGHGGGQFAARVDWLAAMEAWREQGIAPTNLIAMDGNTGAATAATNGRTRPLCPYPLFPMYTGPANPTQAQQNDAANFTCAAS